MDQRELWLTQLSDEEIEKLSPWDILLTENAQRFLVAVGRSVLKDHAYHGLARMPNEELLHEMYPVLAENLPSILRKCIKSTDAENRDRFIFGCLQKLVKFRLTNLVFGTGNPRENVYLDELNITHDDSSLVRFHELMNPAAYELNEFYEARGAHEPSFLSESEFVADREVQRRHVLIEGVRTYLSCREAEVLRHILLLHDDRSLVALELGTTPKQVSRYRASIQRKLQGLLLGLGWTHSELEKICGKVRSQNESSDSKKGA